ncbi:unnamed protein product [Ixodes hexagonus]
MFSQLLLSQAPVPFNSHRDTCISYPFVTFDFPVVTSEICRLALPNPRFWATRGRFLVLYWQRMPFSPLCWIVQVIQLNPDPNPFESKAASERWHDRCLLRTAQPAQKFQSFNALVSTAWSSFGMLTASVPVGRFDRNDGNAVGSVRCPSRLGEWSTS